MNKIKFAAFMFVMALILGVIYSNIALSKTITLDKNTITLRGEVDTINVNKLIYQIATSKSEEITLFILSPGGSVLDGDKFLEFMKITKKKLICVAEFAASMSFSIFQHCDKRYLLHNGLLMQHQASYGVSGSVNKNKAIIKFIHDLVDKVETSTAKSLNMSLNKYRRLTNDDLWLYGKSAFKYKAADELVDVKCSKALYKKKVKEVIQSFFGTVKIVWSGCPLITVPIKVNDRSILEKYNKQNWDTDYIKNINTLDGLR